MMEVKGLCSQFFSRCCAENLPPDRILLPFALFIAATCLLVEISALHSVVSLAYISLILVGLQFLFWLFVSSVCGVLGCMEQALARTWGHPLQPWQDAAVPKSPTDFVLVYKYISLPKFVIYPMSYSTSIFENVRIIIQP
jgi:hypothetical protein